MELSVVNNVPVIAAPSIHTQAEPLPGAHVDAERDDGASVAPERESHTQETLEPPRDDRVESSDARLEREAVSIRHMLTHLPKKPLLSSVQGSENLRLPGEETSLCPSR